MEEILGRVERRLSERAGQSGMQLVVEGRGDARSRADVAAVEQILFNLVDNACKYAAVGDSRVIHLGAGVAERYGVLRVHDHGPGISPAEAGRLFQPFHKSARQAANSAPGVGLGLALSRRLARAMSGDLRLVADERKGACFELRLPLPDR